MKKAAYFISAAILFTGCAPHTPSSISNREARKNNQQVQKDNRESIAGYTPLTSQQYISRYKDIAIKEMNQYGIPASITLAQGLYESGSGNSELARFANNHFGIKCTSDWKGKGYYKDDDEHNDCFRVYDRPEDSFRDHSEFLKRPRYTKLFLLDKNDYVGWANGLKAAGYATNPNYPQLLSNIIQKYNLDQYDRPETEAQKEKRENKVLTQINDNGLTASKDSIAKTNPPISTGTKPPGDGVYIVHQGDTLYNISKRFGLTVDELKALNNMADNN